MEQQLSKLRDFLTWMSKHIKYGWISDIGKAHPEETDHGKEFMKHYRLSSPDETIARKLGICWDEAELLRTATEEWDIKAHTIYCIQDLSPYYPTHTFCLAEIDNKYYWLENSWETHFGINGPYGSLNDAANQYREWSVEEDKKEDKGFFWNEYTAPEYGITAEEFMLHCDPDDHFKGIENKGRANMQKKSDAIETFTKVNPASFDDLLMAYRHWKQDQSQAKTEIKPTQQTTDAAPLAKRADSKQAEKNQDVANTVSMNEEPEAADRKAVPAPKGPQPVNEGTKAYADLIAEVQRAAGNSSKDIPQKITMETPKLMGIIDTLIARARETQSLPANVRDPGSLENTSGKIAGVKTAIEANLGALIDNLLDAYVIERRSHKDEAINTPTENPQAKEIIRTIDQNERK